jgi:hypothetical protein
MEFGNVMRFATSADVVELLFACFAFALFESLTTSEAVLVVCDDNAIEGNPRAAQRRLQNCTFALGFGSSTACSRMSWQSLRSSMFSSSMQVNIPFPIVRF